jgi:cob(I)alamin adenosyltransferase
VDLYGTLDELNSFCGLLRFKLSDSDLQKKITRIQNELFVLSSEIAANDFSKMQKAQDKISAEQIERLETEMDAWGKELPALKQFILPGGSEQASLSHVARTICRRAERGLSDLVKREEIRSECLVYLNRLSDWLFLLARKCNQINGVADVPWEGLLGGK